MERRRGVVYFCLASTPVIENSEPNFRKGSKSAIRRSSANDRFLSHRVASVRCNTSAVIEGVADLAAHPTACL